MGCTPAQETDGAVLARMGTDAAVWAREMADAAASAAGQRETDCESRDEALARLMTDDRPGELLHVWLCNAIEAGRAAGYAHGRQDAARAVREAYEADKIAMLRAGAPPVTSLESAAAGVWAPYRQDSPVGVPATSAGRVESVPAESAGRTAADYKRELIDVQRRIAHGLERIGEEMRQHRIDRRSQ